MATGCAAFAAAGVAAFGIGLPPGTEGDPLAGELVVATYNLRYASATPPNAWPDRRPLVKACLESIAPDLLGTQEGVYEQLKDLAADLPAHDWIGLGREGGSRGEFMAVYYRRDRFDPLEYDHFWLSDTPQTVGSATWGNRIPRMVTWVRFRDRRTDREIYFWNTHFDHESEVSRQRSAALVAERIAALPRAGRPLLLVGDFNAVRGKSRAYEILVTDHRFADVWEQARATRHGDLNTFNDFAPPKRHGEHIDWILASGDVAVRAAEVVPFEQDGRFPSDHFPVAAWLRLK
jgi:endonuclease/exonuclease/phosphatase family metal-dependent hydrolase